MKSVFVWTVLFMHVGVADAAMSRVVRVDDSRTIVVETKGVLTSVTLRDVVVPAAEEKAAVEYLRRTLSDRWVYVERGDVYRSPDGLDVTSVMRKGAWSGATFLGILDAGFKNERPALTAEPERKERRKVVKPATGSKRRRGARPSRTKTKISEAD